ncbi:MAG: hypothetical protein V4598_05505 [Bdellovibrionota bacterium]
MVSCFKRIASVSLLALALSCGQNGYAPLLSGLPYDGVACDETILTNLTSAEFLNLVQAGTSASSTYNLCIGPNVSINAGGTGYVTIDDSHVRIQGFDSTTSSITNLELNNFLGSPSATVSRMKVIGNTHPAATVVAHGGSTSYLVMINSVASSAGDTIYVNAGGGGDATLTVSGSTITSTGGKGIYAVQSGGGDLTASITSSVVTAPDHGIDLNNSGGGPLAVTLKSLTVTTGGTGIYLGNSGGGDLNSQMGALTLRASGSGASSVAIYAGNSGGGSLNATSSGGSSSACNVSGSAHTFSAATDINNSMGTLNDQFTSSINAVISTCP